MLGGLKCALFGVRAAVLVVGGGPAPYNPVVKPNQFSLDLDPAKGTLKIVSRC